MLDVRRLRTFLAAATEGSFTGAAKVLFMTHSAVSQQMSLLEREVGLPLIERTARGVSLTEPGQKLAERCQTLFGLLSTIEAEMNELRTMSSSVRLSAYPTASAYLIPLVMQDFVAKHPTIDIEFIPSHVDDIPDRLRDGGIQVGLTWEYGFAPRPANADIAVEHLLDEPLDLLLPATHPLAHEPTLRLEDLADERWVMRSLANICRIAGFEPTISFSSDNYQLIHGFVAAGIGISFVPRYSVLVRHPDLVAIPIDGPQFSRRIMLLTRAQDQQGDATQKLIEVLRARVAIIVDGIDAPVAATDLTL